MPFVTLSTTHTSVSNGTGAAPALGSLHADTSLIPTIYTVSHKKRATLFLIITLAFLGRFLYFVHQWKEEGILYIGVNKIYHFTLTVSPHYLVKLKRHLNSTF